MQLAKLQVMVALLSVRIILSSAVIIFNSGKVLFASFKLIWKPLVRFQWALSTALMLGGIAPMRAAETSPRLAVVISIDQCRADYLVRFRPYFGEGGFKLLLEGGADFQNDNYRHAVTKTAPGHASILSGVEANVHGIVSNDWLDRTTFVKGNSVEDVDSPLVGLPPVKDHLPDPKTGRSPRNLLAPTVGDLLKEHYGTKAKVFGVSDKDRAAILLAGHRADAAYWVEQGQFVTSHYYRAALPGWVEKFNREHGAVNYFGRTWDRLLAPKIYDAVQGPDNAPGESAENGMPITFPKRVDGGTAGISQPFYDAFDQTPWNNDMIEGMVEQLVDEEKLGQRDTPDLLCIGFSQPDRAGHAYGPDSHEIMDSIVRLDRDLAQLFRFLDAKVGLAHCVIVVTADHGVCPLPEHILATPGGGPAGRLVEELLDAHIKKTLDAVHGALPEKMKWARHDGSGYHLNPAALKNKNIPAAQLENELRTGLLAYPMIAFAYTRAQLMASAPLDAFGEAERLSFYPPRSPDVMFVVKEHFIEKSGVGATHGTPYEYDTHVPLVWFGVGVKPGVYRERVSTDDIAPTLCELLGLAPPPKTQGHRLF